MATDAADGATHRVRRGRYHCTVCLLVGGGGCDRRREGRAWRRRLRERPGGAKPGGAHLLVDVRRHQLAAFPTDTVKHAFGYVLRVLLRVLPAIAVAGRCAAGQFVGRPGARQQVCADQFTLQVEPAFPPEQVQDIYKPLSDYLAKATGQVMIEIPAVRCGKAALFTRK